MLPAIDETLRRYGGVAPRARLLTVVTRGQLDHEISSGQRVAPFRRALCRPWDAEQPAIRDRAALTSVGPPAALSHLTPLRMWGLSEGRAGRAAPRHCAVVRACIRPQDGLVVHRASRFPAVLRLGGLIVTEPAESIVGVVADADGRRATRPGDRRPGRES